MLLLSFAHVKRDDATQRESLLTSYPPSEIEMHQSQGSGSLLARCRVLALMGGEPLLRPDFAHKVVYYAAKKGFWIYIGTNGRLLRPDVADRLGDAGTAVFNFAVDSWDEKPGLPKAVVPVRKHLEHLLRKQYVRLHGVFQHEYLPHQHRKYPATH